LRRHEGDEVRPVHATPALLGGLDELEGHRPAEHEPAPLVTGVRSHTVENVDSIGLVDFRWI
jgi:hypothetical protein